MSYLYFADQVVYLAMCSGSRNAQPGECPASLGTLKRRGHHLYGMSVSRRRYSKFLVSLGSAKDGVGTFYLGKATGVDLLAALARKLGLSSRVVRAALGRS